MRENLPNLKGARKTMPSTRKSILKSGLSQIAKIDQSTPNAEVRTPVHLMTNERNLRVFVVNTFQNSTLENTSGQNFKAAEQISVDLEGSQRQIEMENSSKFASEQHSNRFTPISIHVESGGVNNYGKRSTERVYSSYNHSRNKALKVIQEIRKYPRKTSCDSTKTSNNFPMLAKKFENVHLKHLKENLPRTILLKTQNGVDSDQGCNKRLDGTRSFQMTKMVKHGKILGKENQHPMPMKAARPSGSARPCSSTNFAFYKVPGDKLSGRHFPRLLIHHNMKGNSSRVPASQNVPAPPMKEGSIPRLELENNNIRADNLMGCMPSVAPVDMPFSDHALFPQRSFSVYSNARRMTGTATRGPCQNAACSKFVYPNPFQTQQNPRLPVVPVTSTNLTGTETSKSCGSATFSDSHRPVLVACSQKLTTESRLKVDGSKRDIVNYARKQSQTEENPRVISDNDVLQLVNSNDEPKKGEDKILNTRRMLDNISELLNDINEELSGEFECHGLELSLPIWKKELEQCILSVEKIKNVFMDHFERK